MKILHWDEMFHPTFGYQINVLTKFQVKQGHEVIIMTSDRINEHPAFANFGNNVNIEREDKFFSDTHGVKIVRLAIHRVVSGRVIYKQGYLKRITQEKPDIIMCHTNDTLSAIRITQKLKYINTPIVFDNHMLEMSSKNIFSRYFRIYFKLFVTPIIKKNNLIVIKTQDDHYVNKFLGIPNRLTPYISFGTDTTMFYPDIKNKKKFRKANNIDDDDFVVLYTGKLTEAKGGKILAEALKKRFITNRKLVFVIVGNVIGIYGNEVQKIFNESENKIIRFQTQNYVDLPKFYQAADLCVFPKQCSLSVFDAQVCGLPVIAEDNNINIDRLSHNNGLVYKKGNIDDFRKKILYIAELSKENYQILSKNSYDYTQKNFDYKDIAERYTKILSDEYEKYQSRKEVQWK